MLVRRGIDQPGIDRDPGTMDPGVDPAEPRNRFAGGRAHLVQHADVGSRIVGRPPGRDDVGNDPAQDRTVARHQHHARAACRRRLGRDEPDA